jgi:hypothetical protein
MRWAAPGPSPTSQPGDFGSALPILRSAESHGKPVDQTRYANLEVGGTGLEPVTQLVECAETSDRRFGSSSKDSYWNPHPFTRAELECVQLYDGAIHDMESAGARALAG